LRLRRLAGDGRPTGMLVRPHGRAPFLAPR
jgi:hypothetical protein